jgi:hypothetical protein
METYRCPIEPIGARTDSCLRVAIAFEEAGLPYQTRLLDPGQGEQRSPFRRISADGHRAGAVIGGYRRYSRFFVRITDVVSQTMQAYQLLCVQRPVS